MWGRSVLLVSFALVALGTAKCPRRKTSPVREILCYTSISDAQILAGSVCSCTTLVHQNHDVRNVSISDISDLRKSLKEMHPSLQFAISIHDPAMTLRNSAMVRQEAIARIIAVMKEVDGVEMNVTAGSKERLYNFIKSLKDEMIRKSYDKRIFIALPTRSEDLAKQFDIKELIKYIDLFTLPTDYMTDEDGAFVTFHPSRLMGLFDMLNTDSLVDLISGLGAPKQKILMTLPASAYKFTLKNEDENAPRSETTEKEPVPIDRKQLCEAMNSGEWTVERDEDLTAPYAFQNKTWIAFEDKISVGIKGKYALLRDLAGLAVRNIENDVETECEEPLSQEIYHSFTEFRRKSRQAVLNALEDELHQMQFSYPNHAKTSSFRVVRVVDTEGHIRAVRESTQTEFVCRRQGYFVHPKSCNRFYRCVKFNQEIEDYSVFEFDCPAGLSFDERTEVCVWPGSLPEGSPCPGSSEIAPVAPKRFECSQPGYYADPQNCRWFFACMDLGGAELMAFEFRCPYGLVFDEKKLVCEWPWLVPACSESGSGYARTEYNYGGYTAGASTGDGAGGYVTSGLPEYSVTAGRDHSNVDYSRTTDTYGTNYFGSTAGNIGKPGISVPGDGGLSGSARVDYSKSDEYGGTVSSVPAYNNIQTGSVPPNTIVGEGGTGYSASSGRIGGGGYGVSTGQGGAGYSGGFNTGFAHTGSSGGVTAGFGNKGSSGGVTAGFENTGGFSGATAGEYSGTASGTHLTEQGETYSGGSTSNYPSLGGYVGSTTSSIDITDYSRIPGGVGLSGSSIDSHVESTSPKYGQTNIHAGSSAFNADGYSSSTGIYSGVTGGRQPSFGQTGPSVSHPGATGNIEITGTTNRESTATAFRKSTDAGYSKATGGISSTESNVHQFTGSGVGFNPYSTTASGRVPGADFTYGVPKSELGTSGISTVSGHVGITSRPTGPSSTGYKYNEDGGYTVPVFIQHEEPIYPSAPTGTTGTLGVHLPTGKATFNFQDGRTNFARPNLNVSIYGNEIPTGYDDQKGTTGTIQTGSSIDGNIITGDSFSGNVFSHGNVPGAVSTPAVNQGTIIAGEVQPGYVATSSRTPGYVIGDGVKTPDDRFTAQSVTPDYSYPKPTVGFGSAGPGILYGTPSPGGPIQITYHGGAPATGSIPYSSTPSEGLISTTPQGYKTDNRPETHFISYKTDKHTEKDIPDYRPTSAILPDSNVPGIAGGAFAPTFQGSTTAAPGYSPSKSAVFTPSGFTKTGPTRTGITTAVLGGGGSYSISPGERRPAYSPDNISEKAFEGNVAGYTSSNDGSSVTLTPPGYSSTPAPGGGISVQSPTSGYSYPRLTGQFGTSGAPFSSTAAPGGSISVQSPTSGYSYPRPTGQFGISGAPFSSTAAPGGSISVQLPTSGYSYSRPTGQFGTSGAPFSSTPAPGGGISVQSPTSGYSYPRPTGQFGTSGVPFSSTPAPGGGISVQSPTSGYSYLRPTGQFGTSGVPFSSTPAPGGGISVQSPTSGYSYPRPTGQFGTSGIPFSSTAAPGGGISVQSPTSGYSYPKPTGQFGTSGAPFSSTAAPGGGISVQLPTSGYSYSRPTGQFGTSGAPFSSTPAPGDRVTVQPATSGYSYSKPTVQFGTSRAPFFSTSIGSNLPVTTPTPFFSRLPTSTVSPVIYTTEHPEIYQSTIFESKKIPGAISTDKPISNTVYKISSPLIDDQFTQRTGDPQTATVSPTSFDLGLPFQQTDSSGQTGYGSSLGYLPAKSTPGVIASTTKYEGSTPRPDFIGVTYKKPSPIDVSYGGPSSFQTPTYRPPNYYDQGFSTTPSSLETTPGGGSPTNLDISRYKIDQLITNYDRGTVKYTPPLHDTYPSSGFGSTRKFISSSTQSSFSTKFGSGFTTPSGIRPSTLSYEVTTKSPEGKGKVIVKWSDLHPLLLGKLGAECTCKADPFANIRGPAKQLIQSSKGKVDLANYDSSEIYVDLGSSEEGDYSTNSDNLPAQPFKISVPETSDSIKPPSSAYLPAIDARISAKNNELRSGRRGKKLEYEEEVEEEEEKDEYNYDDDPDQIINGVSDCARPGLFRHPGLCNKFYACHWDQWKKKFTLHIFNCPVHLTFDSHAGACNWPSKGPACQADNLLV